MRCRSTAFQNGRVREQEIPLYTEPGIVVSFLGMTMLKQCLQVLQQNRLFQPDSRRQAG